MARSLSSIPIFVQTTTCRGISYIKNIEIAVRIHINIKNDILFVSDFFIFTQDVSAVATAFFSWYLQEIARD